MHILHFFKTYYPDTTGGIEQVIFQLCEGGKKINIESEVLTLSKHPDPSQVKVGSHCVTRIKENFNIASTGISISVFKEFKRMAAKADIIHFHFPWPMMDLVHLAIKHGKPTVLSYHSDIVQQKNLLKLYSPVMNSFLKKMDRIIVSSPNYLNSSNVLKKFEDKCVVVPFGLNISEYPKVSDSIFERFKKILPNKFFLFVGVLRYYKGLHILLEAMEGIDYPVVIIGNGPLESELKEQAKKLNLKNTVFLGRLDDEEKSCLLQMCYALVFPSHLRSEAFGISLLEASMYGKPMISCEIGTGTTFVNQHEHTGLAIEPNSSKALRHAMERMWDNPAETEQFGINSRDRFNSLFTAERMCSDVKRIYSELLESRNS